MAGNTLTVDRFERLDRFLEKRKGDTVPEPLENEYFIEAGIETMKDKIKPTDLVLDVGCGRGYALDIFSKMGIDAIGITIDKDDMETAKSRGRNVELMDMSFLEFEDEYFNGIWARHSLEHSIFPYFTLSEFSRVLKPKGWMYVEVPGINTVSGHELNKNHYSVLTEKMWVSLMCRAGFKITGSFVLMFDLPMGKEKYYRFITEKM
jgi:ubiquinone/menaquinone biosynthesis C-methylase UbiE